MGEPDPKARSFEGGLFCNSRKSRRPEGRAAKRRACAWAARPLEVLARRRVLVLAQVDDVARPLA